MGNISTCEAKLGIEHAHHSLANHLRVGVYRDQVAACRRLYTQLARTPDFRGRELLHRASWELRRPLKGYLGPVTFGSMSCAWLRHFLSA
jgi:hypothetical protein